MNELKSIRNAKNLSQLHVAKAIGINQSTLSRWENDLNNANISDLIKLADFYEITVDELIGHEVKKNF